MGRRISHSAGEGFPLMLAGVALLALAVAPAGAAAEKKDGAQ
jgi:hypothetical protein